jgi:hypothetical protein
MRHCTLCSTELAEPLYTYGDHDAPMCQSCYLDLLSKSGHTDTVFRYEPVGNGWYRKCLTEYGAIFLEGTEGECLALVYRPERA